jgi:hypothetical protein
LTEEGSETKFTSTMKIPAPQIRKWLKFKITFCQYLTGTRNCLLFTSTSVVFYLSSFCVLSQMFLCLWIVHSWLSLQLSLSLLSTNTFKLQSYLYIKDTEGNLKMCPLWAVVLYIQVKIMCTFHQWETLGCLYIDSDLLYRGALYHKFDSIWLFNLLILRSDQGYYSRKRVMCTKFTL